MVELLADLADLVAGRRVWRSDRRAVPTSLEYAKVPPRLESGRSNRGKCSLIAAGGAGGSRLRRLVSNFGAQLSNFVYLRTDCHLYFGPIHAAGNGPRHF